MGRGVDPGKHELGDVGSKFLDDHFRDGASGSGRSLAYAPGWFRGRTALGLGIVDSWNALPCFPLAEAGMAQQPRHGVAAPATLDGVTSAKRADEHPVAMDQGPQRASSADPR